MLFWVTLVGSQAALFSSLPILFPVSSSDPVSTVCAKFGDLFLNIAPASGSYQTSYLKIYFHCSWQVKTKKVSRVSSFQNLFFFIPTAIASPFCEFLKHLQLHWNLVPGQVFCFTFYCLTVLPKSEDSFYISSQCNFYEENVIIITF